MAINRPSELESEFSIDCFNLLEQPHVSDEPSCLVLGGNVAPLSGNGTSESASCVGSYGSTAINVTNVTAQILWLKSINSVLDSHN